MDTEFSTWANLASILGLAGTVWSLWLARRSLSEARAAQAQAKEARADAEKLRDQYARKSRLPALRDGLDSLATELDLCLIAFSERDDAARECAGRIAMTLQTVARHLDTGENDQVVDRVRTIERNSDVRTLPQGQAVRTAAREVVLYLTHIIEDEQARSL